MPEDFLKDVPDPEDELKEGDDPDNVVDPRPKEANGVPIPITESDHELQMAILGLQDFRGNGIKVTEEIKAKILEVLGVKNLPEIRMVIHPCINNWVVMPSAENATEKMVLVAMSPGLYLRLLAIIR